MSGTPSSLGEVAVVPPAAQVRVHRIDITARSMVMLLAVVASAFLLLRITSVILVVITSLLLVGTLSPPLEWLEAHGMRRGRGIALLFTILLAVVLLLSTLTIPELIAQVTSLIEQEPVLRERLAVLLSRWHITSSMAASLRHINYGALLGNPGQFALKTSMRAFELVAYGVGAVFLALYMMIDRDRLRGAMFALVPRTQHIRLSRILLNLEHIVGGYIRGQLITCLLMGGFMLVLLSILHVKGALAIAVLAGLADVLPYIGVLLVMGPALLATMSLGTAVSVTVAISIFVYQELESRILIPMVYARSLRLPSSVVLVALLTGGTLMGIAGALLALPVAAALLMLVEELRVELPGQIETPAKGLRRERDEVSEQGVHAARRGIARARSGRYCGGNFG
ncbi:MAG: AI-2E family transporter [Gemmatimonadaceae bacterium]|nr:AI-2E family transporter [Gemmatimonadaceae bacterium]